VSTCVIFNPVARGDKARFFQAQLSAIEGQCTLKPTPCAGGARKLAAAAVEEGFEIVVAAGGDGTVNEVLNGISDAPNGLSRTRFGVLPLGTTNVFAKELRIPADFPGAWKVICEARETQIDAPWAHYINEGRATRRYFAQMAGAGIDSRAIELVDWEMKKKVGRFAYIMAGLKAISGPLAEIVVSNGRDTARGKLVLIGNGRFYGGRFNIFPHADLADGVLEVVVYPRVALETLARGGWGMICGDFHTGCETIQLKGTTIEMTSSSPALFHLDGENVGPLPATFSVARRALRVLAP